MKNIQKIDNNKEKRMWILTKQNFILYNIINKCEMQILAIARKNFFYIFVEENMKKIIALVLVAVMAVMMFACGNNADTTTEPAATTEAPGSTNAPQTTEAQNTTTSPTQTTSPIKTDPPATTTVVTPPDPSDNIDKTKQIVYLPVNSEAVLSGKTYTSSVEALNITTGEKVGKITIEESNSSEDESPLVGGHFYLIDVSTKAVVEDLGTARGKTGQGSIDMSGILLGTTWKDSAKYYNYDNADFTNVINPTKLASGKTLGYFGTMEITNVTESTITATVDGEEGVDITNYNWKFVYFDYEGNTIKVATKAKKSQPILSYNDMIKIYGRTSAFFSNASLFYKNPGLGGDKQMEVYVSIKKELPIKWYAEKKSELDKLLASDDASEDDIAAAQDLLDDATINYEYVLEDLEYAQNDIFWSSDVANSRLWLDTVSANEREVTTKYPVFDYFYDAATETYVVYVTTFRYAGDMTSNKNSRVVMTMPSSFDGNYTIN